MKEIILPPAALITLAALLSMGGCEQSYIVKKTAALKEAAFSSDNNQNASHSSDGEGSDDVAASTQPSKDGDGIFDNNRPPNSEQPDNLNSISEEELFADFPQTMCPQNVARVSQYAIIMEKNPDGSYTRLRSVNRSGAYVSAGSLNLRTYNWDVIEGLSFVAQRSNTSAASNTTPSQLSCPVGSTWFPQGFGTCSNTLGSCMSRIPFEGGVSATRSGMMNGWYLSCPQRKTSETVSSIPLLNTNIPSYSLFGPRPEDVATLDPYSQLNPRDFAFFVCEQGVPDDVCGRDPERTLYALGLSGVSRFTYSGPSASCFSVIMSPLVVDLGRGVSLADPSDTETYFDLNGDADEERISCVKEGAFLTLPDSQGLVHDINNLFGDNTVGPDGLKASNGFLALAKHDDDRDGIITSKDSVFERLKLWKDDNCDGVAARYELKNLESAMIAMIDLDYADMMERDAYGNETRQRSVVELINGRLLKIFDVWFKPID